MQSTVTQAYGAGAQSQKNLKWWSWSLKFEFPFNWHIWYCKPIIQWVLLIIDQIVLEPERKSLDAWSRSPKFEFRRHSPCSNHCEPCPWLLSASFWSRLQLVSFSRIAFLPVLFVSRRLRYLLCMCNIWLKLTQQHILWETSVVILP